MKLINKIDNKLFKLNNTIEKVLFTIVDLIYPICALGIVIALVIYFLICLVLPMCKFIGL